MSLISIKNLKKTYGKDENLVQALRGINLEIEKGGFEALAGPSGCGKSTLLNAIGCLDSFDEGSIQIDGIEVKNFTEKEQTEFRRKNLGFVFQSYNLIPVLTVYENIAFPLSLLKVPKNEEKERVFAILKQVGLEDYSNRRPAHLSGGQQQRVAIARALVKQPTIVLADEPTANLDSKNGEDILDLMRKMNKESQVTFLFSTHDKMVMERANRVAYIKDGQIIKEEKEE